MITYNAPSDLAGYNPIETAGPGHWYDEEAAERAVDFFPEMLVHVKGTKGPFYLEDWQKDATRTLFGWKDENGFRRYRHCYWTMPRKNGKTTWVAGIANYVTFCDGEVGAENYCAASDREQASLVYNPAASMVEKNDILSGNSQVIRSQKRIIYKDSFLRAIPANEGGSHGFNSHFVSMDELHAWFGREFYDVLCTSTGARDQPILLIITTAGYDRTDLLRAIQIREASPRRSRGRSRFLSAHLRGRSG